MNENGEFSEGEEGELIDNNMDSFDRGGDTSSENSDTNETNMGEDTTESNTGENNTGDTTESNTGEDTTIGEQDAVG